MSLFRPSSRALSATFVVSLSIHASLAFSWGAAGHSLVNDAAAELSESAIGPFLRANSANLRRLANVPDQVWKQPATREQEKSTHFFQWDRYSQSPLDTRMPVFMRDALTIVDRSYVVENGSAVWRVDQIYKLLVQALRSHDWPRSLQLAGVLGHYVGDLSQPMHDTSDYDGQSIGKRGIHAYYESALVGKVDPAELRSQVLTAASQRAQVADQTDRDLSIVRLAFNEGKEGLTHLADVLAEFAGRTDPNDEALKPMMVQNITDGAVTLKAIWDMAAAEARVTTGLPTNAITVADPTWIPLDF